jgi:hypothetical protein
VPPAARRLYIEELEDRLLLSPTSAVFEVDPSHSSLTLSGTVNHNGIDEQDHRGSGSLTTTYSGTVAADWDLDDHTIEFNSAGTAVAANISGSWQPNVGGGNGRAPANYGATVDVFSCLTESVTLLAAVRNLVASISTAVPLSLTPFASDSYTFSALDQALAITAGSADYHYSGCTVSGSGNIGLAGLAVQNQASAGGAFLDEGNGAYGLRIPIAFTITQNVVGYPVVLYMNGTISANVYFPFVDLSDGSVRGRYDYATQGFARRPVPITDPAARVIDTGTGTVTSMTVTLTNRPDGPQEYLAADLSGTTLSGSYDPATGTETITGNASAEVYTNVLRRLTYETDSFTPGADDRIIRVVVSNSTGSSVVRTSTVSVIVPPASRVALSDIPSVLPARMPADVTLTAFDLFGDPATFYRRTVHFWSTDPAATLPPDYTFTSGPGGDNGRHTWGGGLILRSHGPQIVGVTDTADPPLSTWAIVDVPSEVASALTIDVAPPLLAAGVAGTLTVTAKDSLGQTATAYRGTVTFTSSDPAATLPGPYTFTPTDGGVHRWPNGMTLRTAGLQTITVADDANRLLGSVDVYVLAGAAPGSRNVALAVTQSAPSEVSARLPSERFWPGTGPGPAGGPPLAARAAATQAAPWPLHATSVDRYFAAGRRKEGVAIPPGLRPDATEDLWWELARIRPELLALTL